MTRPVSTVSRVPGAVYDKIVTFTALEWSLEQRKRGKYFSGTQETIKLRKNDRLNHNNAHINKGDNRQYINHNDYYFWHTFMSAMTRPLIITYWCWPVIDINSDNKAVEVARCGQEMNDKIRARVWVT